jgi:UDP-N-acetylglucosamine 2-epimerase (non-hydrolysing)
MKVITILGTRPEIIRTSRITPKLDERCEHIIVHTNQNFSKNMKDIFFEELGLRQPDITLYSSMKEIYTTHTSYGLGQQIADMFPQIEKVFNDERPDKVFILGDTNSALCAIIAERMGIPVYHMEAANRNFNHEVPEEVNRTLIDHISSYNLFYTDTNRHTLLREGIDPKKIFQCGNPTLEVLDYYKEKINDSQILYKLGLMPYCKDDWPGVVDLPLPYFLVDIHRSENVNNTDRLEEILKGLNLIAEDYRFPVICSIHPKTKDKLTLCNTPIHEKIKFLDAFGFFDFVKLEKNAKVGLTDSGLCSEEYCVLKRPCVIVRNETERPEVVEAGGAIISGINAQSIFESVKIMSQPLIDWTIPEGYDYTNVSSRVVNYILSKNQ